MYRIGVVGPEISVDLIINYAKEMQTDMQFHPYPYSILGEIVEILETNDSQVDFWIFSGPLPYKIALTSKVSDEKMEFIYTFGEAIFHGILKKSYEIGRLPKGVSFDIIAAYSADNDPKEALMEIIPNVFVFEYEIDDDVEQIYKFHLDLFNRGEIDMAATTYPSVQEKLIESGVPAYWMGPQQADIYHSIQILNEKVKTRYYKGSQATAILFQINDYQEVKIQNRSGYKIHFLDIDLKRKLLLLCEELDGYLVENGEGRYTVFSTRGVAERKLQNILGMLKSIERELSCTLSVGIGNATTVYHAENYANQALQHRLESPSTAIVMMKDDGEIVEYKEDATKLNYTSRIDDPKIAEKLAQSTVSIKVFSKLESIVSELKWSNFIAKDLAQEMNMTERNAQRIVSELLKIDLIEHCGEEHRNARGRSTKIYRLKEMER